MKRDRPSVIRVAFLCGCALLGCASGAEAQSAREMDRARGLVRSAFESKEAGDLARYRRDLEEALELRPGHPELIYYLAGANALHGESEASLALLGRITGMGMGQRADLDVDFETLRGTPAFDDVLRRLEYNRQPAGVSRVAFTVPARPDFIPEGIAYDDTDGAFYLGSVRKREILRVDADGVVTQFAAPAYAGLWSVMGMTIDVDRRHLWVCTAALPETEDLDPEEEGRSAVFKFDVETGELLLHYHFPRGKDPRTFGDLAVTEDGTVFISDARGSGIYMIRSGGDFLEVLVQAGVFASPQGLALSDELPGFYVADYSKGIFFVDKNTARAVPVRAGRDDVLLGIDGLVRDGRTLIAVQNGTNPHRILRLHLADDGLSIQRVEVMARNLPEWDEPTLGVMVGRRFYYVSNSHWNRFENGALPDPGSLSPPRIMWLDP